MSYNHLFQKTYDLVKWVYPTVNRFPRSQRLILSQRIEVTSIRILELVIDFEKRKTETNRRKISNEIHKLQILFRICKDLSYLSFKRYEHASSLLNEISQIIADWGGGILAMDCTSLYDELCSFRNLELAFRKARRNKRNRKDVQKFELNLESNLLQLGSELRFFSYIPSPLKRFVIRDPKTRLISASDFRDRVVHHAVCNIIQPVFEKSFIHDSYANRLKKGSSKALERYDGFKRKVTHNGRTLNHAKDGNMVIGYILKADIRHYFDTIDHDNLISIIKRKISDRKVIRLIRLILENHTTKHKGKGMPIGNLTSQFFANLYLNDLDHFVKHKLKASNYIRYVDDFVILGNSEEMLRDYKTKITGFLGKSLKLDLHPEKSNVYSLCNGVRFLGFRIFYHYKIPRKSNIRKMEKRLSVLKSRYERGEISFEDITKSFQSWMGYAMQGDTYKIRKRTVEVIGELSPSIKVKIERK